MTSPMKVWLVYEHGNPVEFHGLFRRKADAEQTYRTERENLRASGGYPDNLDIEEFTFQPRAKWSD